MSAEKYKFQTGKKAGVALAFFSGVNDGLNQQLNFHGDKFAKATGGFLDPYYWVNQAPYNSWERKWAQDEKGDVMVEKERFFLSSRSLVAVTDGHHLTRLLDKTSFTVGLTIMLGRKQKLKYYAYDALVFTAAKSIGFNTSFYLIEHFGK